ncbi:hypothetical protein TNCV_4916711 [Trichonephila clavipes]|nr:hypothetical protein TNCV_4916711 [Trichonephila clavipes]
MKIPSEVGGSTGNKQGYHEDHLRQQAQKIISCIPKDTVQFDTDGSRTENRTGGVIGTGCWCPHHLETSIKQHYPETKSIFRKELIEINVGLGAIESYDLEELWIFSLDLI